LRAEWRIQSVGVAKDLDVCCSGSFAEHLDDWIAGDEVDQEKDNGDHDP
jgi:hypothetical protein